MCAKKNLPKSERNFGSLSRDVPGGSEEQRSLLILHWAEVFAAFWSLWFFFEYSYPLEVTFSLIAAKSHWSYCEIKNLFFQRATIQIITWALQRASDSSWGSCSLGEVLQAACKPMLIAASWAGAARGRWPCWATVGSWLWSYKSSVSLSLNVTAG